MVPRKHTKSNIRTLNDLDSNASLVRAGTSRENELHDSAYHKPIKAPLSSSASAGAGLTEKTIENFRVCHIPTLLLEKQALAMIQRVAKEFEPIIRRRGYNVKSVSEMCCCFDGLDFTETGSRRGGKKCRVMPANVWGYNQTTGWSGGGGRGYKSHTIHLRLRHPRSHNRLLLYEDVAGTMAHELAHCEIGPHNDQFNKLMDDILEEHTMLQYNQASGIFGGSGQTLGGNGASTSSENPHFPGAGMTLGGNSSMTGSKLLGYKLGGDNNFTKLLTPAQAACMAAEARRRQEKLRLRGQHCCQPCVITIPDNEDEEPIVEYFPTDPLSSTSPKSGNKKRNSNVQIPNSSNNKQAKKTVTRKNQTPLKKPLDDIIDLTDENEISDWGCRKCTFINHPMALACSICGSEKVATERYS